MTSSNIEVVHAYLSGAKLPRSVKLSTKLHKSSPSFHIRLKRGWALIVICPSYTKPNVWATIVLVNTDDISHDLEIQSIVEMHTVSCHQELVEEIIRFTHLLHYL